MDEEKIIRVIIGDADLQERESVFQWISESPENKEQYYQLKNLWALTTQLDAPSKIEENDLRQFQNNIRETKIRHLKLRILTLIKYAAIFLIALITGKYLINTPDAKTETLTYNEITTPPGQMAKIMLSDGTLVHINSCSRLKYPSHFGNERKIILSGEAFFEVSKGETPFLVETRKGIIKVLGTRFNVMAYPNDRLYQTTLVEGKIELQDTSGNRLAELKPGEQFTSDLISNNQIIKSVKTNLFDSWKEGIYIFDHHSLEALVEQLERVFAVKISIKNDKIRDYKFTGTISRNVPFEQILKIIQISAPVKYNIKEENGAITEVTLF